MRDCEENKEVMNVRKKGTLTNEVNIETNPRTKEHRQKKKIIM